MVHELFTTDLRLILVMTVKEKIRGSRTVFKVIYGPLKMTFIKMTY